MGKIILLDGNVEGETFSGDSYRGEYPTPRENDSYRTYREWVDSKVKEGFHLGDLSDRHWQYYCKGSGHFEGVDSNTSIS